MVATLANPVPAWILDNSYSLIPATTVAPPIRQPKVSTLDGIFTEQGTSNLFPNPNLAGVLGQKPASWGSCTVDNAHAFSGTTSAKVAPGVTSALDGYGYVTIAGGTWAMSTWVYAGSAPTVTADTAGSTGPGYIAMTTSGGFVRNKWQRWLLSFVVPAGTSVNVRLIVTAGTTAAWYGGCQLEQRTPGFGDLGPTSYCDGSLGSGYSWDASNNPLTNSSYESGLTGWTNSGTTGFTVAATTAQAHSGTQSALLTFGSGTGGANFRQDQGGGLALPPGTWTVSAWVMNPVSGGVPATGGGVRLQLNSTNEAGVTGGDIGIACPADGVWRRFIAPAATVGAGANGAGYVRFINSGGVTGQLFVDDVQLEARSYATSYGATAASAPNTSSTRQTSYVTWNTGSITSLAGFSHVETVRHTGYISSGQSFGFNSTSAGGINIGVQANAGNFLTQVSIFGVGFATPLAFPTNPIAGDLIAIAVTLTSSGTLTQYVSVNGGTIFSNSTEMGALTNTTTGYQILGSAAVEQALVYNAVLSAAEVAAIFAAPSTDITDDGRIVFAAASRSTAGTVNAQSASTTNITTYRGRSTSFNTYGGPETAPIPGETTTTGGAFRITAAPASGVGVGDRISFSQIPASVANPAIFRVVAVEAMPGQYDELYVVAGP